MHVREYPVVCVCLEDSPCLCIIHGIVDMCILKTICVYECQILHWLERGMKHSL